MVLLSTLRQRCSPLNLSRLLKANSQPGLILKRHGGHGNSFVVKPSSFNFKKSKDLFHLYSCVAFIIYGSIVLFANVYVGSATLIEIPEGYRPPHWEYFQHPITRLIQRYCFEDPQENHEKFLHYLYEQDEIHKIRELDRQVDRVMKRRKDYEAHYYLPLTNPANALRDDRADSERNVMDKTDSLASSGFSLKLGEKDSDIMNEFSDIPKGVDQ